MSLTVEDGSGLVDANAFASIAEVDAYHDAMGNAAWTGEDAAKEAAIRRATAFLSNSCSWAGLRTRNRSQALAWPRSGVWDGEGNAIASDEIPHELVNATAEIALRELEEPGAMNPDFIAADAISREKVEGMEVQYANRAASADAYRPVIMTVRDLIGPFLRKGAGNPLVGRAFRV
ncbi:DnaT-like ssDNA-binding protein [Roseibium sp. RKSG952]|uniref:DnaT-like ssDNA-binding protein n=1 Tax=Roseibium sp. RKSG952 TaxID=2529384 RepID=UPI0012BB954F|nr:DnaT-like ssDNA-binding protein [Roseibium sp. RKSG952]MTH96415.1 hypothetical protein [Roseibium sp. RKSG952]